MANLVAYYRVSTKRQEESGLGLAGQVDAVERYATAYGGNIIKAYQEAESGRKNDRVELRKAIAHAKRSKATLVIAKLDRLARNVAFTANLLETKVDFVACDNPHANTLTIHILAAVAEDEAKRISDRTSAALQAFVRNQVVPKRLRDLPAEVSAPFAGKLGGARPGGRKLTHQEQVAGAAASVVARQEQAREAYADLAPWVRELRAEGLSLRQIAARLEAEGQTLRGGGRWNAVQVSRLLAIGA